MATDVTYICKRCKETVEYHSPYDNDPPPTGDLCLDCDVIMSCPECQKGEIDCPDMLPKFPAALHR